MENWGPSGFRGGGSLSAPLLGFHALGSGCRGELGSGVICHTYANDCTGIMRFHVRAFQYSGPTYGVVDGFG